MKDLLANGKAFLSHFLKKEAKKRCGGQGTMPDPNEARPEPPPCPPLKAKMNKVVLTTLEAQAIEGLLKVAYATYNAADNSHSHENDFGRDAISIPEDYFEEVSDALDELDKLPDDCPGYTMAEPAKARWALRRLILNPSFKKDG